MLHTALSAAKIKTLIHWAKCASHTCLGESAAELGVFHGGGLEIIAKQLINKTVYGFDTFEGMPKTGFFDSPHFTGWFKTDFATVQKNLSGLSNIKLIKGLFPSSARKIEARFCFVHVDADILQSTLDAIRYFYPRLAVNGIMIFDDYDWPECPGVRMAIHQSFRNNKDVEQRYLGECQFLIRKKLQSETEKRFKLFM